MIFQRLIWSALAAAVLVGSVQTGVQRWQAAPIILAAEVIEEQKAQDPASKEKFTANAHIENMAPLEHAHEHEHEHGTSKEWQPENGAERIGWTWVANILHAFSMALLMFAVMGVWLYRRGAVVASLSLSSLVAAAGWLSFHLWPSLGLHAEVPGVQTASLHASQAWWALAVGCAALACAMTAFFSAPWRWFAAALLLALPFVVGAPQLQGDALAGYGAESRAALEQLQAQVFWATTWVSLSFWTSMGLVTGLIFQHWLRPSFLAILERADAGPIDTLGVTQ